MRLNCWKYSSQAPWKPELSFAELWPSQGWMELWYKWRAAQHLFLYAGHTSTCVKEATVFCVLLATETRLPHHCLELNDSQPWNFFSGLQMCKHRRRYERDSKNMKEIWKKSYQEQMPRVLVFPRDFHQCSLFHKDLKGKKRKKNNL